MKEKNWYEALRECLWMCVFFLSEILKKHTEIVKKRSIHSVCTIICCLFFTFRLRWNLFGFIISLLTYLFFRLKVKFYSKKRRKTIFSVLHSVVLIVVISSRSLVAAGYFQVYFLCSPRVYTFLGGICNLINLLNFAYESLCDIVKEAITKLVPYLRASVWSFIFVCRFGFGWVKVESDKNTYYVYWIWICGVSWTTERVKSRCRQWIFDLENT